MRVLKTQNVALTARLDKDEAALVALGGRLDRDDAALLALGERITQVGMFSVDRDVCYYAFNWDTFGGFWHLIDLIAQAVGARPAPPWPSFDDKGACSRVGSIRRPPVAFRLAR